MATEGEIGDFGGPPRPRTSTVSGRPPNPEHYHEDAEHYQSTTHMFHVHCNGHTAPHLLEEIGTPVGTTPKMNDRFEPLLFGVRPRARSRGP